jgi:RHS repeat-associated protein
MITDINAKVVQQVLYAPFGEVITEYNAYWHNGLVPDYMFNAKELDEESGMYYYEARYYAPPSFISRDPLFEKYPTMSPYAYCANNPVKYIDPDGRDYYNWNGKYLGKSENKDDVFIVSGKDKRIVKKNEKNGKITDPSSVKVNVQTTKVELKEALHVLKRTEDNGGDSEESSVITPFGQIYRAERGNPSTGFSASSDLPNVPGNDNTSIHSHRLNLYGSDKNQYAGPDIVSSMDKMNFSGFKLNIVVGYTKPDDTGCRKKGATFYDRNHKRLGFMDTGSMDKIVNFKRK